MSNLKEKAKLIMLIAGAVVYASGIALEKIVGEGYATLAIFIAAYIVLGGSVVLQAIKNIAHKDFFDENFLMSVATIGAFAIGQPVEAVGVMLFYQVGEYFQDMAVSKSKKSIADLMDIRPDFANVKKGESIEKVAPNTVQIGELVIVKPGEKIPLDGVVVEGRSMVDTSALTGEPVPRKAEASDAVLSGCVNISGVLTVKVTKAFGESTVSKILNLVENAASKKAKAENFITKFAHYYTPAVVGCAVLLATLPPLFFGGLWGDWINRGLIFLVISCPCALVMSIPLSFFSGIGSAAKNGILVKGGNYLEAFSRLETVVFDKTGTLTKGVFKVTAVYPANGFSGNQLLEWAAHAEAFSNHPIALSVMREYGGEVSRGRLSEYTELSGCGVSVKLDGKLILAGNERLMAQNKIAFNEMPQAAPPPEAATAAGTKVYVAANGEYAGCMVISDEVKPDSRIAIAGLKAKGVRKTVMLTGDNPQTANAVAAELGLDEVHGGLLPHEKVRKLETIIEEKHTKGTLAFVGDGINDAPVLAMADIGVAMGGLGSDAAIEAADVVLMTDEPSKIIDTMGIARFTMKIVWQNIVFSLGVKAVFLLLGAFGLAAMWEAVFADVGVLLLAVFNSLRIIRRKVIWTK